MYEERFCRILDFYLALVLEFLQGPYMILTIQREAVPIIREFINDAERAAMYGQERGRPIAHRGG